MKEIEKKYLVEFLPDLSNFNSCKVSQGYLSFNPEVRIRMMDNECFFFFFGDGTLSRDEDEESITLEVFKILYDLVQGNLIDKTRVFIPIEEGYTAELDIYHGELNGLLTIEVEFPSEEEAKKFIPPIWFGNDITNDKRFKNKNLARSFTSLNELLDKNTKKKTFE